MIEGEYIIINKCPTCGYRHSIVPEGLPRISCDVDFLFNVFSIESKELFP